MEKSVALTYNKNMTFRKKIYCALILGILITLLQTHLTASFSLWTENYSTLIGFLFVLMITGSAVATAYFVHEKRFFPKLALIPLFLWITFPILLTCYFFLKELTFVRLKILTENNLLWKTFFLDFQLYGKPLYSFSFFRIPLVWFITSYILIALGTKLFKRKKTQLT